MCSLLDYIANKLSKDKIVDLSVNIDKHPQTHQHSGCNSSVGTIFT